MFDLVFSIIIYILFILLVFVGIKKQPLSDQKEFGIRINSFRGVIALAIVIGHCVRYDNCYLTPFGNMMLIGVGYFFFVSGYGLANSYYTKHDYLNSFFRTRVLRLLYVVLLALILTKLISIISPIKTGFSTLHTTIPTIAKAVFFNTNWYLWELLLLYLLFYLVFRYVTKYRFSIMIISTLALCIFLYFLGCTRCWYASIFCFPMGIYTYEHYNTFKTNLMRSKGILTVLILVTIGLLQPLLNSRLQTMLFLSFQEREAVISVFNNILCIGCLCSLIIALNFFSFGNKLYPVFSKLSASLYVLQFVFLLIAETAGWNYPMKIVFVLIMDTLLSIITFPLFNGHYSFVSLSQNKKGDKSNV